MRACAASLKRWIEAETCCRCASSRPTSSPDLAAAAKIGNVGAGALLGFFLAEIGPSVYNKAVADVQDCLQVRVSEIQIEVKEDEFPYWHKA